jgi:histidyl-tRNA synthetase
MPSPFTEEHVKEWASFGPKLKGKPTPEELVAANERKEKCTAMKRRLAAEIDSEEWTEKKIEKELDRLVEEGAAVGNIANIRPLFLDGPSGTRDFLPEEMRYRNWLFQHWRQVAQLFGFVEYDAPVLEHVELYERKAGEEIVNQMYAFVDQEGTKVTLRPEMTPTLARLVLAKTNLQSGEVRLPLPLKWYSIPQCWRFETTQRGRKREHYQWNMDIVGVDHVHAEIELLAAACCFFQRVGLTSEMVGIKVNSRAILESILAKHGVTKGQVDATDGGDVFAKACICIDKLDKIGGAAVTEELAVLGITAESSQEILQALQAPAVEALTEIIGTSAQESPAISQVQRLFELASDYGVAEYLVFDASVVRGLAYYTGIVWEAFDRRGVMRAIMGGGRYDRLMELYGGSACSQISCVGFGFGDCVIMELLQELNLLPSFTGSSGVDYVVCAYSPDLYGSAANIAGRLRACGWSVDLMPTPKKKVANSFKHADQTGAKRMVFVAPDEIARGVVRIKDLRVHDKNGEGIQVDCPLEDIPTIDELFAKQAESEAAA